MRPPSILLKSALETAKQQHTEFFGFFNRLRGARHIRIGGNRPFPVMPKKIYMNSIKHKIIFHIIRKLLEKPCPVRIPRSGRKGSKVNCYVIGLYIENTPFALIENINGNSLQGKAWNGKEFCNNVSVPINWFGRISIKIEHYYGLSTITYKGLIDYALNEFTGFYVINIMFRRAFGYLIQQALNQKNLVLPERMKLLSLIVSRHLNENTNSIDSLAMMTYLHSPRWFIHPKAGRAKKRLDLYLFSFAESGELKKVGTGLDYEITGKAIATLDAYEIADKRHRDSFRIQFLLVIITFVLAVFAAIQSGVIKIPTIIDFSDVKHSEKNRHNPVLQETGGTWVLLDKV